MGFKELSLGLTSHLSPVGKIALMVLKPYTGFSGQCLIEHLNGNIHYQLFCETMIDPFYTITNFKMTSAIRSELHIHRPRNKFDDVSRVYLLYCKKRKRKTSRRRMLKGRLFHLQEKLLF